MICLALRRLKGHLIVVSNFFVRGREADTDLFSVVSSDRTQGNVVSARFRLDIRKSFFALRMVEHWNRLPGKWLQHQLVISECKISLKKTLRSIVRLLGMSCMVPRVGLDPCGSHATQIAHDSVSYGHSLVF